MKQLVLAAGLFDNFEASIDPRRLDEIWRHSRETCTLAALFVESLPERAEILDAASSAALMHEAGRLILISNFPRRYAAALERAGRNGTAPALAEVEEFGAEHGRIGAYVLSLWGLPRTIVEAVAFHSWPSRTASAENLPLAIVHAACLLAHDPESEALDMDYLTAHGMNAHLEGWRRIAAQPAEAVQ